ncbi:MAG: hypothetical protein RLZZ165_210 [Bacteroidota bacterium]|jgi:DNA-directed RNA polymerase subunit F
MSYKIIDGIEYEQELLNLAEALTAGAKDGRISLEDAKSLVDSVMDGGQITRTERRTLHYIFDHHRITDKAKEWLQEHLFRLVDDVLYDKVLMDAAELAVEGGGDGRISLDDAELILRMVESDREITAMERRTLGYIVESYRWTDPAKALLSSKLG